MLELRADALQALREGRGEGVRVLLLDSGVEVGHPLLASNPIPCFALQPGPANEGSRVVEECGRDDFGHGTAVAGIIRTYAPEAELHSLRVLGPDLRATPSAVLEGLAWGIRQGYDLLNCSFGTTSRRWLPEFEAVIDQAYRANVWIVAAADSLGLRDSELPAHFPTVFGTALGSVSGVTFLSGEHVEFAAPGDQIRVAWKKGGFRTCTGSSFAAPYLTALLTRLFSGKARSKGALGKALLQRLAETGQAVLPAETSEGLGEGSLR